MLKMIKYEFRKNLTSLVIMFATLILCELYFIFAYASENETHVLISVFLLAVLGMICYGFVIIFGIKAYNNDLKEKSGYLVFMAPISYYSIIGAKLLATLITGLALVVVLGFFFVTDYSMIMHMLGLDGLTEMLTQLFEMNNINLGSLLLQGLVMIILFLINFFTTMTIAYFSITLSSTILRNKKGKGFMSTVIFFVILFLMAKISSVISPEAAASAEAMEFSEIIVMNLPEIIESVIFMIGSFLGTAGLLNKEINL